MSPEEKAQVIESAMEEIMAQPKRGAWLILRDIADAYRAESETMTVDRDPSADDHRDLIGFLRENATELGIVEGWSTEDRADAHDEAQRRFQEWIGGPEMQRFGEGCVNGFMLGAEWWKATHPTTPRPMCPKHAHIGHSAELPCYWCSVTDSDDKTESYCESCEADRLWEEEGMQPVWASPTHTCDRALADHREVGDE